MKRIIGIYTIFMLFLGGFSLVAVTWAENKTLEGKTVALIIASQQFRDEEFKEPRDLLTKNGAKVIVASTSTKEAAGMLGMKVKPDILIGDLSVDVLDAVIFIGGMGASEYFTNPRAWEIARETFKQKKVLGAICIAPVTLAEAGLLKGKKATVWQSERKKLETAGAKYTGRPVTIDGNIVTANGPKAAKEFAQAVVGLLRK